MKRAAATMILALAAPAALSQVQVKDPWVRATVPQQRVTGAFMQLSAPADARLVGASSPVAGVVELHEMAMERDVMRMRAVPSIAIPAGRGAELRPGGYHLMLMDLKGQVKEGDVVPITLMVEGADGKRQSIEVRATARPLASSRDGPKKHMH